LHVVPAQHTNAVVLAGGVLQGPVGEEKTLGTKVGALDESVIVDVFDIFLVLLGKEGRAIGKPGLG
jgi:hypothetical protein